MAKLTSFGIPGLSLGFDNDYLEKNLIRYHNRPLAYSRPCFETSFDNCRWTLEGKAMKHNSEVQLVIFRNLLPLELERLLGICFEDNE
jgi:hypothetical protein